jgi:hypothetical protein
MNRTEFTAWLEASDGTLLDGEMVSYVTYDDGGIDITDMDDDHPSTKMFIGSMDTIIDNGTHVVVIETCGTEWIFRRLTLESEGNVFDAIKLEEYLEEKEAIAGILFEDNELPESYERPSEEHCHLLADLILKRLGRV